MSDTLQEKHKDLESKLPTLKELGWAASDIRQMSGLESLLLFNLATLHEEKTVLEAKVSKLEQSQRVLPVIDLTRVG